MVNGSDTDDEDKEQLLRVMKRLPHRPQTEWAAALGWFFSTGRPNSGKIARVLKQLEADDLVIQIGHRYLIKFVN